MLTKLRKKLQKLKKRIYTTANVYLKYSREPIDEKLVLLEGGQGKNINGNMFAFLRELCENPEWKDYQVVYVVVGNNEKKAHERFEFYGYHVMTVIRNSKEYCRYLATAKYLLTDNSFPPYFNKREEQIYLNTWHGTPLKTLGKSEIQNVKSMANIQKNYLMCDYALFPNEFTRDIFMKDYMLENLYKGKIVLCDYPRNSILFDKKHEINLREKLGLQEKQIIAYMPTWRGANRKAEIKAQQKQLMTFFNEIDSQLTDNQLLYVNLHFLVADTIDYSGFKHILSFPKQYETYDFLAVCDILVTDYSSVFFDFACPQKKVILFPYDLEEYMSTRGTYFPLENLPFPIVQNTEQLVEEIDRAGGDEHIDAFFHQYCAYRCSDTARYLLRLMIHGENEKITIENPPDNGKSMLLIYGGDLKNKFINRKLLELISVIREQTQDNILLCFNGNLSPVKREFLTNLPDNVSFFNIISGYNFSVIQKILAAVSLRFLTADRLTGQFLNLAYQKERKRLFYRLEPIKVINASGRPNYMYRVLATFSCKKEAHIHHENMMGLMTKSHIFSVMEKKVRKSYDIVIDHRQDNVYPFWEEEERKGYYNKCFTIGNICTLYQNRKEKVSMYAAALVKNTGAVPVKELKIAVNNGICPSVIYRGIKLGKAKRILFYSLQIPFECIGQMNVNNRISFVYQDTDGYGMNVGVKYKFYQKNIGHYKRGPIHFLPEKNTSVYFRQSVGNRLYLTVRETNMTDSRKEQRKLLFAYYLSKICPSKNRMILFEKNSSRYEESASVLYERLIDEGYSNAYFFLDRNYPFYSEIPEEYRSNLVDKGSFRHYLYFFQATTFIGSETLGHAIDLRIENKYARKKLLSKDINYVFLQHGVMYMISMDSEARKFFRPVKTNGKYRVVTSSKREAEHFTDYGKYSPSNLYICGLPKFDRSVMDEDADKIVIMITWRPWEFNQIRFDFKNTKYYQMICRIFDVIPGNLKEKVIILPHPLFFHAIKNLDFELKEYMKCEIKYDDILKKTKVMITDYSSISYDAFYRGANVIFYWEEKDECLEKYGPSSKLMLNEDNAFGDICYDNGELESIIQKNYEEGQRKKYIAHYREIVEFHDGKNTERLIEMLKEDQII